MARLQAGELLAPDGSFRQDNFERGRRGLAKTAKRFERILPQVKSQRLMQTIPVTLLRFNVYELFNPATPHNRVFSEPRPGPDRSR